MNPLRVMIRLLLLLILLPLGASAQVRPGPSIFVPGAAPPTPPPFTQRQPAPGPRLGQIVEVCTATLADPTVSLPAASSPWVSVSGRSTRSLVSDQVRSAPQAIFLSEDAGGVASLGQQFSIPAAASEITGTLAYRYASGTTQAGDKLQVEIYALGRVDIDQPIMAVDAFPPTAAATQADGLWHTFTWGITDTVTLGKLNGLSGQAMFLVTMRSVSGGPQQQLWVDNIDMGICASSATVSGRVTQAGVAAADAQVLLARTTSAGSAIIADAITDGAGLYSFFGVSALGTGESYQVWFLNTPLAIPRPDGRLGFWAGPTISTLGAGETKAGQDMAVGDVVLGGPASYSAVVASDASPVTLSWAARGVTGELYEFCVYDPQRIDPDTKLPPQVCGPKSDTLTFALSPQSFNSVPGFDVRYGRSYRWYVVAYDQASAQYGYSFSERAITLLSAQVDPPTALVTPSDTLPAAASSPADWTLMVYAAGDNSFGDPANASRTARLDKQIDELRSLASAYPQLHLVTLSDTYGNTGAQFCYLPPKAAPDCQERGEISTGDPATLGGFIKTALARYPASHTMLIIAGPGHPIGGVGYDLTAAGVPSLDIDGLSAAFDIAGLGAGGTQLDVIFYQASLMGAVEVVTASAPYARYMVASADEYWSLPLYNNILPLLAGAQKDQPAEVAKGLIHAYGSAVGSYGGTKAHTLAAYDLSRAAAVSAGLNGLGSAFQLALTGDSATVRDAIGSILQQPIQAYDSSGNGLINALEQPSGAPISAQEDALVDIQSLASAVSLNMTLSTTLRNAGSAMLIALNGDAPLVLASVQVSGAGITGRPISLGNVPAAGLSVFLPTGAHLGGQPTLVQRYLYGAGGVPRDSGWAGFLRAYLARELGRGPGGVTAGPLGGAQLRGTSGILTDFYTRLPIVMR